MNRSRGVLALAQLGMLTLLALAPVRAESPSDRPGRASVGLDHVIVAVHDLEKAAQRYRELGFSLKPGRPHDNGIRNQHVKFPDGIELELITAAAARDDLTAQYRRHLADGDGPAFFALYAPDLDAAARRLDSGAIRYVRSGPAITFPEAHPLRGLFFWGRNRSPTDRPEHFAHPNTAQTVIGLWLAGDLAPERNLLALFGGSARPAKVRVPDPVAAEAIDIDDAQVYLLPVSHQVTQGRKIVGVTVRVQSLASARAVLKISLPDGAVVTDQSLFLPPSLTHGIWIELRETRPD